MSRKSKTSVQIDKVNFIGVIQLPLHPDDEPLVLKVSPTDEAILDYVETLVMTGYEVSIRYDPNSGDTNAVLKGVYSNCTNAGYWLYSSGDSIRSALQAALFKHFEMAKQAEWKLIEEPKAKRRFK